MWVDGGNGQWVWRATGGDRTGAGLSPTTPKPLSPPPSAGGGRAPAPAQPAPAGNAPPPAYSGGFVSGSPAAQGWFGVDASGNRIYETPEQRAAIDAGPGEAMMLAKPTFVEARERQANTRLNLEASQRNDINYGQAGLDIYQNERQAIGDDFARADAERSHRVDEIIQGYRDANTYDSTQADASRNYQQQVLQQQQSIVNRILDFDPEQYAQMFADQSLTALNSNARSTRGGAGAVNSAVFGAQQQAPALFAQGQEQAAQLENQRLQAAGTVTSQMGGLATDVRQGDEQRSQFVSSQGMQAQQGIASALGVDMQLDASAVQQLGEFRVAFANVYKDFVQMDLQEQLGVLDSLTRQYATDAQLYAALQKIRADAVAGKTSPLDVGLAILGVAGQVGAGAATGGFSAGGAFTK
jgi:hypothetical protein